MPFVVEHVSKRFGLGETARLALRDVAFSIDAGEFVAVVGPSGCGKSTLLGILAGLVEPTSGSVSLDGERVTRPPEGLSLVFQDYSRSLFPWLSVEKNVALALRNLRLPRAELRDRVLHALTAVGLSDTERLYPWQLSGGMQQRVAIARALVVKPKVMLMDEPFAAVDAQTRADLEDLVLELWEGLDITILFVTHDIDEAVYLSDRVLVMGTNPGHVESEVAIPLPRPRDQIGTKELSEYTHLRSKIFELVMRRNRRDDRSSRTGLRNVLSPDRE